MEINYGKILSRIKRLRYRLGMPKVNEVIVDITAGCNANCPFCSRNYMPDSRKQGIMSLELFKFILNIVKHEKIKTLRLYSSSEPLLHPHLDEILALTRNADLKINLSTNAGLLDKNITSLLNTVDVLQYSIEGWDKASYEKLRTPLKWQKIRDNICLFNEARKKHTRSDKISTRINLIVTRDTNLEQFFRNWDGFSDEIMIHPMLPATLYDGNRFRSKYNDDMSLLGLEPVKDKWCSYPFHSLTIGYDGEIGLCCGDFAYQMKIGNISDGLGAVLRSPVIRRVRKEFVTGELTTCSGCSVFLKPTVEEAKKIKLEIDRIKDSGVVSSRVLFSF